MRDRRSIVGLLSALMAMFFAVTWLRADDSVVFQERVLPLVKKYCIECHSGSEPEAELSFDTVGHLSHVDDHPELWENIAEKLRRHEMPPADHPQPPADELKTVDAWISARMTRLLASQHPNPGRVTMRRLNRAEYNNTIRDLVGVDFRPANDFPVDDTGYGFDNIGDVLALPPLLMEKYFSAAEQIIDKAIVEKVVGEPIASIEGMAMRRVSGGGGPDANAAHVLHTDGLLEAEIKIPATGQYEILVKAFGTQAGADPARMSVRVDGNETRLVDVPATSESVGEYSVPWTLTEGSHRIGLAFVNDYYRPDNPDKNQRDRNLGVVGLEIVPGGEAAWEKLPEVHRGIIQQVPTIANRRHVAKETIHRFAERAFRRPMVRDEMKRLFRLYEQAERSGATFEQSIKIALTAILVSPNFLFRVEIDRPGDGKEGSRDLNDFELASRLSYFLWSSMPDKELFDAARNGGLTQRDDLKKQLLRMLDDPRSSALVEHFAGQWLQLGKLGLVTPDSDRFPQFTDELRSDMRRETELFFEAVMREDRQITDLLDADFTFVNERLARHYDIEGVEGNEFRRVAVMRETRGGIPTQASILTLTSNPTRTSPVKRGKWVLENLLGEPPPPPPPEVPELAEEKHGELRGTLRQRMEQHRSDSACGVCHNRIDPLGFGLENYDAVGRWRTNDGDAAVDASGVLPDGTAFNGPRELKQLLISRRDEFTRALAEKMLVYALGRGLTLSDRPAIDQIIAQATEGEYKFKSLILAIVSSEPFLKRSLEETR